MTATVVSAVLSEFTLSTFYLIKKEACFHSKSNTTLINEKSCFDGELIFILAVFSEFALCTFYFNKKKYPIIKNLTQL